MTNALFNLCIHLSPEKFQRLYMSSDKTKWNIQAMIEKNPHFAIETKTNISQELIHVFI